MAINSHGLIMERLIENYAGASSRREKYLNETRGEILTKEGWKMYKKGEF